MFIEENKVEGIGNSQHFSNEMLPAAIPVRVQRKRVKGWKIPENTVYVGRGSRWGNPFRVIQYSDKKWAIKTDGSDKCSEILTKHCHAVYDTKQEAVIDAIKCYGFWLLPYSHKEGSMMDFYQSMVVMDDALLSLKGKHLACWCGLDEQCHADLLLKLVNG
ncbi:DUF4326 domain-containing protein [Pedobacter sp. BS3]|uniref:DUF4326 domain-containing protein n=1 Tax=Pedobacter sp. BS3 TaxID=2567937 RepID=UPI0018D7D224|nr:DUF4326 domain-containing protein [Pedobacter sp. BS3]